jgi:hypothetical protein
MRVTAIVLLRSARARHIGSGGSTYEQRVRIVAVEFAVVRRCACERDAIRDVAIPIHPCARSGAAAVTRTSSRRRRDTTRQDGRRPPARSGRRGQTAMLIDVEDGDRVAAHLSEITAYPISSQGHFSRRVQQMRVGVRSREVAPVDVFGMSSRHCECLSNNFDMTQIA